jgi:anti-sigma regulatory factor (Ser/Thr protein kinase)
MRAVTGTRLETWLPAKAESAGAARSIVREAAAEAGLDGEPAWDLMVATTEAATNAAQHGRPWPNGCVLFVTEPCPRGLRVEVTDLGTFETTLAPPRSRRRPAAGFRSSRRWSTASRSRTETGPPSCGSRSWFLIVGF